MAAGESILCEAARNKNLERVGDIAFFLIDLHFFSQIKQLIESGENVNQVDKNGETPLIIASCLGYTEVYFFFFKKNPNVMCSPDCVRFAGVPGCGH